MMRHVGLQRTSLAFPSRSSPPDIDFSSHALKARPACHPNSFRHSALLPNPLHDRSSRRASHLLSPERAALCESGLATGRLAKDLRAAGAHDDGLGVGEDGGDGEAARALDVHEEGARAGHKGLFSFLVRDRILDGR